MKCPLCGTAVTFIGLNTLECRGMRCENYKGPSPDERVSRAMLLEFFARVSAGTNKPHDYEIKHSAPYMDDEDGYDYLFVTGLGGSPLCFIATGATLSN